MSKNKITLDSINKEWYSDDFNHNAPIIKKYYSKLSKEKEREIRADTIEYIHLPKQKVYVAQTYHGNIAIGSSTDLYKSIRGFNKSHKKKVRRDERKRQKKNKNYGGKRKMKNKTKKTLKGILAGTLAVGTLVGGIAVINHFSNRADENGLVKVNLKYDIGGLDANGEYEETNESIYTKNAFEAQGLKIEVDFDSNIDYEVFFYDQYGDFISSTGKIEKNFDSEIPSTATHARIEITPQEDEDGIKWYEKNDYASQIEVKVNEEQLSFLEKVTNGENLYTLMGQGSYDIQSAEFTSQKDVPWFFSGVIDCSSTNEIILKIETTELTREVDYNGEMKKAFSFFDLTNKVSLKDVVNSPNIIATEGKYSYVSINCEEFDSFIFATSSHVVDTTAVYLV